MNASEVKASLTPYTSRSSFSSKYTVYSVLLPPCNEDMVPKSRLSSSMMRLLSMVANLMALLFSSGNFVTALPSTVPRLPSHNYNFRELRPQQGMKGSFQQPYFRFNIFLRKNAGITEEEFHRHWKTVHADLTISDKDAGSRLLRYTQVGCGSHRGYSCDLTNADSSTRMKNFVRRSSHLSTLQVVYLQ